MFKPKFRMLCAVACGLSILVSAQMPAVAASADDKPIVVGISAPLSGPATLLGEHLQWGAQLATEQINAAGGVLGRKLDLKVQDNACSPSQGVTSVSRLISLDSPSVLMGALCSSVTLALMPVVKRAQVPLVVSISTARAIAEGAGVGGNDWVFKTNPSDQGLADALVRYLLANSKINRIALAAEDTDYGRGASKALTAAFQGTRLKLVSSDYFQKGTQDYSAELTKLSHEKPDAVALYMTGTDEVNFVRQYGHAGMTIPITGRPNLGIMTKEITDGGVPSGSTSVYPYFVGIDNPENNAFVKAFKAQFHRDPIYQSFEAYEAVKIIAAAINRAGKSDPASIRKALVDTNFESILGGIVKFDDHHEAHNSAIILKVEGGKVAVAGREHT